MGRRQRREEGTISYVAREIRDEAAYQLRGFPRELKHQLRRFGREAVHQLGSDWGEELARQIFGTPKHRQRDG